MGDAKWNRKSGRAVSIGRAGEGRGRGSLSLRDGRDPPRICHNRPLRHFDVLLNAATALDAESDIVCAVAASERFM
jgi:hypothetical protein